MLWVFVQTIDEKTKICHVCVNVLEGKHADAFELDGIFIFGMFLENIKLAWLPMVGREPRKTRFVVPETAGHMQAQTHDAGLQW